MTIPATTAMVPTAPEASPAWWAHWLTVAISTVSFIGVAIHPGWHPPTVATTAAAWLSPALAGLSTLAVMVQHHGLTKAKLTAWVRGAEVWAPALEHQLAAVVDEVPGLKTRVATLEQAAGKPGTELLDAARAVLAAHEAAQTPPTAAETGVPVSSQPPAPTAPPAGS